MSAAAAKPLALSLRRSARRRDAPGQADAKSSRDELVGIEDHGGECVLKARVRAVPEAGRANEALETLIAKWLGVPPSTVTVAHGGKSRLKQVAVTGDAEALSRLIAQHLTELA